MSMLKYIQNPCKIVNTHWLPWKNSYSLNSIRDNVYLRFSSDKTHFPRRPLLAYYFNQSSNVTHQNLKNTFYLLHQTFFMFHSSLLSFLII